MYKSAFIPIIQQFKHEQALRMAEHFNACSDSLHLRRKVYARLRALAAPNIKEKNDSRAITTHL
jgi:hypothetical protein